MFKNHNFLAWLIQIYLLRTIQSGLPQTIVPESINNFIQTTFNQSEVYDTNLMMKMISSHPRQRKREFLEWLELCAFDLSSTIG